MSIREQGTNVVTLAVGAVGLLGILAVMAVALAWGAPAFPTIAGVCLAGAFGAWGGLRARSRSRLRAMLDAFADRELARQR
jgi:hypothetical protein